MTGREVGDLIRQLIREGWLFPTDSAFGDRAYYVEIPWDPETGAPVCDTADLGDLP